MPIHITAADQVGNDRKDRLPDHIGIVILRQPQGTEHHSIGGRDNDRGDDVVDVVSLVGLEQCVLVGEEPVAQHRIEQVDEIQQVQIDLRGDLIVDELPQEGHQGHAQTQHHEADDPVQTLVQIQQGTDGFVIIPGDGLVHAVHHRRTQAQLAQTQEAEDGGEQAAQTQVLGAHDVQDHRAVEEGQDDVDDPADRAGQDVPDGIFGSCDLHARFSFSCPKISKTFSCSMAGSTARIFADSAANVTFIRAMASQMPAALCGVRTSKI